MSTQLAQPNQADLKMRWREPYVSGGLNEKLTVVPRGVIRGFLPAGTANDLELVLEGDPQSGDSLMHVYGRDATVDAGKYAVTYRSLDAVTLDLSVLPLEARYWIGFVAGYALQAETAGYWKAYTQAEYDDGTVDEAVLVCRVTLPAVARALLSSDLKLGVRLRDQSIQNVNGGSEWRLVGLHTDDTVADWSGMLSSPPTGVTATREVANQAPGSVASLRAEADSSYRAISFVFPISVKANPGDRLFARWWFKTVGSEFTQFANGGAREQDLLWSRSGLTQGSSRFPFNNTNGLYNDGEWTLFESEIEVDDEGEGNPYFVLNANVRCRNGGIESGPLEVWVFGQSVDKNGYCLPSTSVGSIVEVDRLWIRHENDYSNLSPSSGMWSLYRGASNTCYITTEQEGKFCVGASGSGLALAVNLNGSEVQAPFHVRSQVSGSAGVARIAKFDVKSEVPAVGDSAAVDFCVQCDDAMFTMGRIEGYCTNPINGTEDGMLRFSTLLNGVLNHRMYLDKNGVLSVSTQGYVQTLNSNDRGVYCDSVENDSVNIAVVNKFESNEALGRRSAINFYGRSAVTPEDVKCGQIISGHSGGSDDYESFIRIGTNDGTDANNANKHMTIYSSGSVSFSNGGTITSGGVFTDAPSDERLKENIVSVKEEDAHRIVMALRAVSFDWKRPGDYPRGSQYGFIAQEVEAIDPRLTYELAGAKRLPYDDLVSLLVATIQGMENRIMLLEDKIKHLGG